MNDPFDPFAAPDFDPFVEVVSVVPAETFDPFAEIEDESAPPSKATPSPRPDPTLAAVPERVGAPAPLRASQAPFSPRPSEPVVKVRSVFAETGDCVVCGEPGGSHAAPGAPFFHQVCRIAARRALSSSSAADLAFVRRCDAAGSRRRALDGDGVVPGVLLYIPRQLAAEVM